MDIALSDYDAACARLVEARFIDEARRAINECLSTLYSVTEYLAAEDQRGFWACAARFIEGRQTAALRLLRGRAVHRLLLVHEPVLRIWIPAERQRAPDFAEMWWWLDWGELKRLLPPSGRPHEQERLEYVAAFLAGRPVLESLRGARAFVHRMAHEYEGCGNS